MSSIKRVLLLHMLGNNTLSHAHCQFVCEFMKLSHVCTVHKKMITHIKQVKKVNTRKKIIVAANKPGRENINCAVRLLNNSKILCCSRYSRVSCSLSFFSASFSILEAVTVATE